MYVSVCVCERVCVRERVLCVCERTCVSERECVCYCVCQCVWARVCERVCVCINAAKGRSK